MWRNVWKAAGNFVREPTSVIQAAESLDFVDDTPSTLFALKPAVLGRETPSIQVASNHIFGFITRQAGEVEPAQLRNFFKKINAYPWLQGLAGWLFEKFVHVGLTVHPLRTTPMKQNSPLVIPVCRNVVKQAGEDAFKNAKSTFCWRPTSQNFTSFDAIVCTPKIIILLQATFSGAPDIDHNGLEAIYNIIPVEFRKSRKWCLVFITDTLEKEDSLRNQSYLSHLKMRNQEKLHVYSCVFDIGQSYLTLAEKEALEKITVSGTFFNPH